MDIDAALNIESFSSPKTEQPPKIKPGSNRWRPTSSNIGIRIGAPRYGGSFDNLSPTTEPRDTGPTLNTLRRAASVKNTSSTESVPQDLTALVNGSGDIPTTPSSASGRATSTTAPSPSQNHPPVVRSRSSYSFQTLSNVLTIPNLMKKLRKNSVTPAAAASKPETAKKGSKEGSSAVTETGGQTQPVDEYGFLKEVASQGFSGIWNHPITRCYFLMFLLWREFENLYYFRIDAQQFRFDYPTLYSSARKQQAYRLYHTYLTKNSPMFILRRVPPEYQNVRNVIANVKSNLESHDATLFDDLAYMVLKWLEDIYNGTFDAQLMEATPTDASPSDALPSDALKSDTLRPHEMAPPSFSQSAFYQAMRNDLRGTRHLTTIQYNRAAERVADMPPSVYEGMEVWEKLMTSLEAMGIDCEVFRVRGAGAIPRRASQKETKGHQRGRTQSASTNDSRKTTVTAESAEDSPNSPSVKDWKRSSNNALNVTYGTGDRPHTFVQYSGTDQQFCEYCFKTFRGSEDTGGQAYRCESCGYVCHKGCRNEIRVSCVKPSASLDVEDHTEMLSDKMRRVQARLQALQREIEIEKKIKDGLDNLVKAKGELGSKSKKPHLDMAPQIERSSKKLEALKHEERKCQLQQAALSAAAAAAANNPALVDDIADNQRQSVHQRMPSSASTILSDSTNEGEVVKVVTMDSAMKAELTKTFYITRDTVVKQLINMALEKFVLPGNVEDYLLSYTSAEGEEVPLRQEDHPVTLGLNLIETPFRLKVNFDAATLYEHQRGNSSIRIPSLSKEDELRQRKQRDVLMEISETEINYAEDLNNIVTIFYRPLALAGVLDAQAESDIFSNIKILVDIHDGIARSLIERREEILHKDTLLSIISTFAQRVEALRSYETYCSNQHNARRKLQRLRADPNFAKLLAQCETNPKLNKLNLPDLLVKPMHRITRYPILFKRLLSNTIKGSAEYEAVNNLINAIEQQVGDINESVRRHEAAYRINVIDENLDFNNVVERFKLANGRRELISEKTFTYLKKNSTGTAEVSVLFFTDLVLIVRSKKASTDAFMLFKPPIPLESAVFLDKPDTQDAKNVFQIIHLQQEIHSLQTISAYDKNTWLREAEGIRAQFCTLHYDFERNLLHDAAERYHDMSMSGETGSLDADEANGVLVNGTNTPAARRRNTAALAPATPKEFGRKRQSTDAGDGPAFEQPADVKRTGSWAHLFKTNTGRSVESLRKSMSTIDQQVASNSDGQLSEVQPASSYEILETVQDCEPDCGSPQKGGFLRKGSTSSRGSKSTKHKSETSLASSKTSLDQREDKDVKPGQEKKKHKRAPSSVSTSSPSRMNMESIPASPLAPAPTVIDPVTSPLDVTKIDTVGAVRASTQSIPPLSSKGTKRTSWGGVGRLRWTWSKTGKEPSPDSAGSNGGS